MLGAFAGYLNADRGRHQIALIVGLRLGLLELNAFLFSFTLRIEHVLFLLGENLLGLRLHQLFRQVDVTDEHIHHVNVILQKMRAHASLSPLLFFVTILQISHR